MAKEHDLQEYIGNKLKNLGWKVVEWGRGVKGERESLEEVVLKERVFEAIGKINNICLTDDEKKEIHSRLLLLPNTIEGIKNFIDLLKGGIPLKIRRGKEEYDKLLFLFDFEHPKDTKKNDFLAIKEFEVRENENRRRFDFCLFVNGIPLVGIELKNPFFEEDKEKTWYDAYVQLLEYEEIIPSIFKYIQFCIISDGFETKHFPNSYAKDYSYSLEKGKGVWKSIYPFKDEEVKQLKIFPYLDSSLVGMLSKANLLNLIENFIFIKRYRDTYTKIMAWYTQFEAANNIVKRVIEEREKQYGLIWHWQGSGKTLTMAFSSWKLLRELELKAPTIFVIVDRKDLQKQIIEEEFLPIGIEIEKVESSYQLARILKWGGKDREGKRGIFICLIQKFNPRKLKQYHDRGEINLERENIVILTDESHRSQYGILANVMRGIFKNASIFGFTGTPLTIPERNTFSKFSPKGELYLHRFGMLDSIRDGFTLPIRYESRLPELHLKEDEIEELSEYEEEVEHELTPREKRLWKKKIKPRIAVLKSPERIEKLCKDIAEYYKSRIEATQLKVMIAAVDRECSIMIKNELEKHLDPSLLEVVMTYPAREKSDVLKKHKQAVIQKYGHADFEKINADLVYKFRNEELPRIMLVSDMLLTGFDAKNLWTLFLYKPLKEHRLLQAIARTNRPLRDTKEFGLVVDYVGIAKKLEIALAQFESDFKKEAKLFIKQLSESEKEFEKCVNELKHILQDTQLKTVEDVNTIVEFLTVNNKEKEFTEKARKLRILYEMLSPSEIVYKHLDFYKWIITVSVMLNRYRWRGMRLIEIEKMAKKTYDLIQKTVGIGTIEKIGEVDIYKELGNLKKPINAIRVLGGFRARTEDSNSDFNVNLREDIEKIIDEMKEEKTLTKDIIEKIKTIQNKTDTREAEKEELGELFPVFEVLKNYFADDEKIKTISTEIIEALKKRELLSKESFLKRNLKKELRRTIRENLIRNFGLVEKIDDIEEKILLNLEEEHG